MYNEVKFEEDTFTQNSSVVKNNNQGGLIGFVVKTGIAKDTFQANIVLVIVAVIVFAITLFVIFGGGNKTQPLTPEQLIQIKNMSSKR